MRGALSLAVFFLMFTLASPTVPYPRATGNLFSYLIDWFSACVFALISKRLGE